MIGAPLALLGLVALAVPVIIHLLGRHQSRVLRFPTLRFITPSRLSPTRRRRLSDIALMLVRMAIVGVAALALSQPYVGLSASGRNGDRASRAIVVDTSASMRRATTGGAPAIDSARRVAATFRDGAVITTIETADPRGAIAGAGAWLETRSGLRELVVVSDFQSSSLDSATLAEVPAGIGIRLAAIPVAGTVSVPSPARERPAIFAGADELPSVDAAWRAIGERRPADSAGRIAIIYRGHERAADLAARATPVDSGWMGGLVARLMMDSTLIAAAATERVGPPPADSLTRVAGEAIVAGRVDERLLLFLRAEAASLTSAALNQALVRALDPAVPGSELDTTRIESAALTRWERTATPSGPVSDDASDGRWLWLVALILIGIETLMRRRKAASPDRESAPPVEPSLPERAA